MTECCEWKNYFWKKPYRVELCLVAGFQLKANKDQALNSSWLPPRPHCIKHHNHHSISWKRESINLVRNFNFQSKLVRCHSRKHKTYIQLKTKSKFFSRACCHSWLCTLAPPKFSTGNKDAPARVFSQDTHRQVSSVNVLGGALRMLLGKITCFSKKIEIWKSGFSVDSKLRYVIGQRSKYQIWG